jgi:hypothetical protein
MFIDTHCYADVHDAYAGLSSLGLEALGKGDFAAGNDAKLAGRGAVPGKRTDGHSERLHKRVLGRNPVADLARHDRDDRHARVIVIALQ